MRESDKYKFWNFNRGERFAVIVLLCCITGLLFLRFYKSNQIDIAETDFKQFEQEISDFEKQVSYKKDTVRSRGNSKRKKSRPVYQSSCPIF